MKKILIVEDEPVIATIYRNKFVRAGFAVEVAVDGLDALQKAQRHEYDLILMDMQMPKLDGLETTRAIRALPGWASKPIIAVTANSFDTDRHACEAAGMNDFIAKPVDPASLYEGLLLWLSASTASDTRASADALPSVLSGGRTPGVTTAVTGLEGDTQDKAMLARLAILQGFDAARGLTVLRGETSKYLALLRRFVQSHSTDMAELAACLARGDKPTALRIAHTLKGTASTLGALSLAEHAGRLESLVQRDGGKANSQSLLAARMAAVGAEMKMLADACAQTTVEQTAGPGAAITGDLRLVLRKLETLLAQRDTAAAELLQQHSASLRSHLGAAFEQLAHHVERFEYASAHTIVKGA